MSWGEVVGLCLTVTVLAGLSGVGLGILLGRRQEVTATSLRDRRGTIARWGAARRSLNRSTGSFIAAFRALSAETPESANRSLREQEAQRARADWFERCREMELAEAHLIAEGIDLPAQDVAIRDGAAIRAAVDGSAAGASAFAAQLRADDAVVQSTMREWIDVTTSRRTFLGIVQRLLGALEDIVNRRARRP